MRICLLHFAFFIFHSCFAQPNTDIWLFQGEYVNGKLILKQGRNITNRKGYDNQPSFSKDSRSVYFTSRRDTSQTDIYRYEISTKKTSQVTFTKTSEYSPAISPSGNLTVLMVEQDNSQRIWEFPLKTKTKPKTLFPMHDSIGYYSYSGGNGAYVYILGNGQNSPNRISLIDERGSERVIDRGTGRGMLKQTANVIYTKPTADSGYSLYYAEWYMPQPRLLGKTPGKSQDLVRYRDQILMGWESTLYSAKGYEEKGMFYQLDEFKPVIDLAAYGLKGISRIAISPDKKWIAIVVADN